MSYLLKVISLFLSSLIFMNQDAFSQNCDSVLAPNLRKKWKVDSFGRLGYRINAYDKIKKNYLIGKSKDEVVDCLGEPNDWIKSYPPIRNSKFPLPDERLTYKMVGTFATHSYIVFMQNDSVILASFRMGH